MISDDYGYQRWTGRLAMAALLVGAAVLIAAVALALLAGSWAAEVIVRFPG